MLKSSSFSLEANIVPELDECHTSPHYKNPVTTKKQKVVCRTEMILALFTLILQVKNPLITKKITHLLFTLYCSMLKDIQFCAVQFLATQED